MRQRGNAATSGGDLNANVSWPRFQPSTSIVRRADAPISGE
jgi:hypothetical protein